MNSNPATSEIKPGSAGSNQARPLKPTAPRVNFDAIPAYLRHKRGWVLWRYTWSEQKGKWDKPPYTKAGGLAKSTDPATWCSFEEARAAYENGGWDGIGYVPDGEEVAFDLDKVVGPDAEIQPKALDIIRKLDSYTEYTPSVLGFRIFAVGKIPDDFLQARDGKRQQGRKHPKYFDGYPFEAYQGQHYLTVTGHHFEGSPETVEDRQAEIAEVIAWVFGKPGGEAGPGRSAPRPATIHDVTDDKLLEVAGKAKNREKFNALFSGDISGYPSASEADQALCNLLAFYTGPDPERMERIFGRSGLARGKWTDRPDYRRRTIELALKGRTEFFDWGRTPPNGTHRRSDEEGRGDRPAYRGEEKGDAYEGPTEEAGQQAPAGGKVLAAPCFRLTPSDVFARAKYAREWYVKNVLVRNQPGVLGGGKKSLKTNVGVDLAVSLGTGIPFLGHPYFEVVRRARVGIISGESGEATLQETALRVCQAKGVSLEEANVFWGFRLPQLNSLDHMAALADAVKEAGIEVLLLDPLYLCVLAGLGADGLQASNMYQMGPLFLNVAQTLLPLGCTPVLVHHFKLTRANPYGEPQLEDLAFSGIQEFCRQWILLGRREKYEPGTGQHKLWLSTGGSAGHSGLWAVDIDEGTLRDDFSGRIWDVRVTTAGEVRKDERDAKQEEKRQKQAEQDQADDNALMVAIDKLDPDGKGAGYNQAQALANLSDKRMLCAATRLKLAETIEDALVTVKIGSKATRPDVKGLRRVRE